MSDAECDSSEDEEEILVYVEFEGFVDNSTFSNEKLQLDMTGLDTDFPIMQVNGKFYEGTYEDAVGTYMFFEKDDNPTVDDPVFDTIPTLKYFAKTRKLLKMQRVFTMPRPEVLGDSDHTYCVPNMDTIKDIGVPPKYQDDALKFWTNMRNDRMEALSAYLQKQKIRDEKRTQGIEPESESDEDSPFAMYKPKKNVEVASVNKHSENDNIVLDKVISSVESERIGSSISLTKASELKETHTSAVHKPKKARRKLTVIDPGPSTSRDSLPYIAPLTAKRKHKATVKVVKRSKVKDVFKKPSKRAPRRKVIHTPENQPCENVTENIEVHTSDPETEGIQHAIETEDKLEPLEHTADTEPEIGTEKIHPEENDQNTNDSSPGKKKLEKQARRDAKMLEITERLRKHRDDTMNVKISESRSLEA